MIPPAFSGIGMTSQRTRDRLIQRLADAGVGDWQVLDVMRRLPRHLFLDEALAHRAYEDTALPIGYNQTLSQPYVVARMTEILLRGLEPSRVLEIGTGSGYQTAVLAALVGRVYSVERIRALQSRARRLLGELGVRNVRFRHADGTLGWPEQGPFDAILCAAAPETPPPELLDQLAPGGRLLLPLGGWEQYLCLIAKDAEGGLHEQRLDPVRFVPLVSGALG